jgi:hypothetical protein
VEDMAFTWLATADARRAGISRGLSIAWLKRFISVPYVTRKNELATMNKYTLPHVLLSCILFDG